MPYQQRASKWQMMDATQAIKINGGVGLPRSPFKSLQVNRLLFLFSFFRFDFLVDGYASLVR